MVIKIQGVYENGQERDDGLTPLQAVEAPMSWPKGADGYIEIEIVDPAGNPVNISGMAVSIGIRALSYDAEPTLARAAALTNPTVGLSAAPLVAADTSDLDVGPYILDAWLTNDLGRHQVVRAGTFEIREVALLPGEDPGAATPVSAITSGGVDTLEELAEVPTSMLSTSGLLLYVEEEGAYYGFRLGMDLDVDGETVIDGDRAGAQWELLQTAGEPDDGAAAGDGVATGTDLTGSTQTVTPGSDKVSRYRLRAAIASGVTVTLSVTGLEDGDLVEIVREASTGAGTLTIAQTGIGGGTWTIAGNLTKARARKFYFNGVDLVSVGLEWRDAS